MADEQVFVDLPEKVIVNEIEDSKELEIEETSEFTKGFCLYKYNPPSLTLLKTDLATTQEAKLQEFLMKRLSKNIACNGNGNLATLSSTDISSKPVTCYYKLIKTTQVDGKTVDNSSDNPTDFLVCFVVTETSNLHLFQQELEGFCKHFESSATFISGKESDDHDISEIFKDIDNWYDLNILYVCRCAKLFKLDLASLINVGLCGGKLNIEDCENNIEEDINKFVAACSLSGLLSSTSEQESNHRLLEAIEGTETGKNIEKLKFSGEEYKFEKYDVCEVCQDWARIMTEGELDDPVFLKQVMENYKLKVIQDMNSLKRLLMEARTDHYALYRSFMFLSKCRSGQVVMEHIKLEMRTNSTKDMLSIVRVLEEFIGEKGGFGKLLSNHARIS